MIVLTAFLRNVFVELSYYAFTKEKKISDLKKGDVSAELVVNGKKGFYKKQLPFFTLGVSQIPEKDLIFKQTPEGLSPRDIKKLQNLEKNLGFDKIRIYEMLAFAPFLFIGSTLVILYYLLL